MNKSNITFLLLLISKTYNIFINLSIKKFNKLLIEIVNDKISIIQKDINLESIINKGILSDNLILSNYTKYDFSFETNLLDIKGKDNNYIKFDYFKIDRDNGYKIKIEKINALNRKNLIDFSLSPIIMYKIKPIEINMNIFLTYKYEILNIPKEKTLKLVYKLAVNKITGKIKLKILSKDNKFSLNKFEFDPINLEMDKFYNIEKNDNLEKRGKDDIKFIKTKILILIKQLLQKELRTYIEEKIKEKFN